MTLNANRVMKGVLGAIGFASMWAAAFGRYSDAVSLETKVAVGFLTSACVLATVALSLSSKPAVVNYGDVNSAG